MVQWRELEMQRDGCCKLGEGMGEALPCSAALSESILLRLHGKTGPELTRADSRVTRGSQEPANAKPA